jgi:hypothetical protein
LGLGFAVIIIFIKIISNIKVIFMIRPTSICHPQRDFSRGKQPKIDPAKVEFFDHIQKIGTPNPS